MSMQETALPLVSWFLCLVKFRRKEAAEVQIFDILLACIISLRAQMSRVRRVFPGLNSRPRLPLSQLRLRLTVTNVGRLSLGSQSAKRARRWVVSFKFHVWPQSRARPSTLVELWLRLTTRFNSEGFASLVKRLNMSQKHRSTSNYCSLIVKLMMCRRVTLPSFRISDVRQTSETSLLVDTFWF